MACSSGNSEPPSPWIRIDSPQTGTVTGQDTISVYGNAALSNGAYPDTPVYWYNNGNSGVAFSQVTCFIACIVAWSASIPLYLGENTIQVTFASSNDSVIVSRHQVMSIGGTVFMNSTGLPLADIYVNIHSASINRSDNTDVNGKYLFPSLPGDTYTVKPELLSAIASPCLSFTPANRSVTLVSTDMLSEDFVASIAQACYSVAGYISASTNPAAGQSGIRVTIDDGMGNTLNSYTDSSGNYFFRFVIPGTYTVTPYGTYASLTTFIPSSTSITVIDSDLQNIDFIKQY